MRIFLLVAILTGVCVSSCEEKEFTKDPAESYKIAKEPYDDEDWEIAIQRLGEFKSRFPYSQYAREAELLIANAHYELEGFEEAAAAYGQFVKLHPKHSQVQFALFRVGESYWALSPEEIDREQEFTLKAIEEWEKLVLRHPDSEYAQRARDLINAGRQRIAESYEFISDFYCKQEIYHACAYRFIKLAREYPQFVKLKYKSLTKAAAALEIVADQKSQDPKSDKNIYFNTMSEQQIRSLSAKLQNEAKQVRVPN